MLNKLTIIACFSLIVSLSSCSKQSDAYDINITKFVEDYGLTNVKVSCDVSGRVGKCVFTKTSDSFDKLIERLNLRDFNSEDIENNFNYYNYWLDYKERRERYDTKYTCGFLEKFSNLQITKVYGNLNRSPELYLENVGSFDRFFLYHRLDTNEACIHFIYAYG